MTMDPERRAALEEERDFLLRSIRDLEAERGAGDIDDADFRTLEADYTARAAEVLRMLDDADGSEGGDPASTGPGGASRRWRRIGVVGAVALLAVVAGVAVMQSSGERGSSALTGLDVAAASSRVDDCQAMEQDDRSDDALACYSEILESLPSNVAARTFRGWLQVREFEVADGLDDLDTAVELDPDATAPYIFRASGRSRSGDAAGAVADLAAFYENEPPEEERALADQFVPNVVDAALDECIDGDVTGQMAPTEVATCYRDVLAVDAGNPTASVYLGWLLARSGVDDEAMSLLDDGLSSDPELAAGYVFRAALRAHRGNTDGALDDLDRFDELEAGPTQVAAAADVRQAIESGEDPLPSS